MNSKLPQESNFDLEQQFILRLPEDAARYLAEDTAVGIPFKDNLTIEMKLDMKHSIVRYNGQVYQGRMMDLPCIIESLKTTDRKTFYKTADISQMMICTQDEGTGPIRGSAAFLAAKSATGGHDSKYNRDQYREFQYLHGITPPLKNVLRRRFRKTRKKRSVDMPQIEKEVKQLLRADIQADVVKWEVVWSDPPRPSGDSKSKETEAGEVSALGSTALGTTGTVQSLIDDAAEDDEGHNHTSAVDRLAVFGVISSSSDSDVSSSCSDDEQDFNKTLVKKPSDMKQTPEKLIKDDLDELSRQELPMFDPRISTDSTQVSVLGGGSKFKNQLAAELLLSDSGEDDSDECDADIFHPQTSTAGGISNAIEDSHAAAEIVLDEDVVGGLADDDDDEFQPGGELLDDPFGCAVAPMTQQGQGQFDVSADLDEEDEPSDDNDLN